MVKHGQAVGHRERLFLIVRHAHEGDPHPLLEHLQFDFHFLSQLPVERAERFVQQQDRRTIDECARQRDALLFTAGKLRREAILLAGQPHHVQRVHHPRADLGGRQGCQENPPSVALPSSIWSCYNAGLMKNVLTMVLAGGRGERLHPLTDQRAKPAVPFGGKYRIIDFTLSNCVNSNLRQVIVLIQYKSHSLDRHIRAAWDIFSPELNEYITSLPPQQRINQDWYKGTADAVYQNWFIVEDQTPEYLLILGGDHVYKMNYRDMYSFLQQKQADVVVGAIEYPVADASSFGVIAVDSNSQIIDFLEKPANPPAMPNDPTKALCSMGLYLFRTSCLHDHLYADAEKDTSHDFGKDIIPGMINSRRVFAYNFRDENRKAVKY